VFQHAGSGDAEPRLPFDLGVVIARTLHDRGGDPTQLDPRPLLVSGRQLAASASAPLGVAYFFMINGVLYVIGLVGGGGWRALLPRRTDPRRRRRA
jgi:hypothetical protein